MSSKRVYLLFCDHEGCEARFVGDMTAQTTRSAAKKQGWRSEIRTPVPPHQFYEAVDYCDEHANERKSQP